MKRMISVTLAFLLIIALAVPCYAKAVFENAGDLYQVWAGPPQFPDYVCGVWSSDGGSDNLTIAVLNTKEGNDGKKEILELVEDDSSVTFVYGEYSRNHLIGVQTEVSKLFKTHKEHGLIGTAYLDKENRVSLMFLKGYEANEKTQQLLADLKTEYGEVFVVSFGDPPVEDTLITAPIGESITQDNNQPSFSTVVLILILLFSITFMIAKKSRLRVLRTNIGETIKNDSELSKKQIKKMIENESFSPSSELDAKIMNSIDEQE